ncbi:hypothetical protein DP140_27295 [Salmonella enterica subsp. enterica serovar Weltevreden]|nr:hypothetical protein DP140_27295 [Salmonella enterica subsp. enterica serovar Weltevreden]
MFAIRPNDFYRCIMSPNMMLARTRPLPIQQGPFFLQNSSSCSKAATQQIPGNVGSYVTGVREAANAAAA